MIKYVNYKDIYFKKRSLYDPINPQYDEECKDLKFLQDFLVNFENVHVFNILHQVPYNNMIADTLYIFSIGSNDPNAILGIDFIAVYYYEIDDFTSLRTPQTFYLVESGPSLKINTRQDQKWGASTVLFPPSAIFFRRISFNSYATKKSEFSLFSAFKTKKQTNKFIMEHFPLFLKNGLLPSKNKCFCKFPNKNLEKVNYKTSENKE